MKKSLIIFILSLVCLELTAQNYELKKIESFNNTKGNDTLYMRKPFEVLPEDDVTGNFICVSDEGTIYFQNMDNRKILRLNKEKNSLEVVMSTDFLETYDCEFISRIKNNTFYFDGSFCRYKMVDEKANLKFKIDIINNGLRIESKKGESFYDKETDILFFKDLKNNIHSIINPGLDQEANKGNYRTPSQTVELLTSDKYAPHLALEQEEDWDGTKQYELYIDGVREKWNEAYDIGKYICKINKEGKYINIFDGKKRIEAHYLIPEGEILESTAFHPCGDAYFLTMNWNTNTHNLYCIENTWDPEWRKQWYEKNK